MSPLRITPDSLDRALTQARDAVPTGKKGFAQADVTLTGVQGEVGVKLSPNWAASAWGARSWKGGQTQAGGRISGSF